MKKPEATNLVTLSLYIVVFFFVYKQFYTGFSNIKILFCVILALQTMLCKTFIRLFY
jgi:hypothetical protein